MKNLYIIMVALYALIVLIMHIRFKLAQRGKKNMRKEEDYLQKTDNPKNDIVGKSKYKKSDYKPLISKPMPLTANNSEDEKSIKKQDNFTQSDDSKPRAEVPKDELDKVFSDTPADEKIGRLDIDYTLEYEKEDDLEDEEDEEDEVVEGMAQAGFASGVPFESLGNVVQTVTQFQEATQEQKRASGETLLEIRQTDMFEQLVSKHDAKETIKQLIEESLSAFYKRKEMEEGTAVDEKKAPDSFDIRDFI